MAAILADFDLAVSLRRLHDKYGPGPAPTGPPGALPVRTMRAASAARLAAQLPFGRSGPLPRSTAWVEVLAGGRSAEVRTKLPLRWGSP